jgi:hypothetical protein
VVRGAKEIPWQKKVLRNLTHFVTDLTLEFD